MSEHPRTWNEGERRANEERAQGLCDAKGALLSKTVRPRQLTLHSMASPRIFRQVNEGVRPFSKEEYLSAKTFVRKQPSSSARDVAHSEPATVVSSLLLCLHRNRMLLQQTYGLANDCGQDHSCGTLPSTRPPAPPFSNPAAGVSPRRQLAYSETMRYVHSRCSEVSLNPRDRASCGLDAQGI